MRVLLVRPVNDRKPVEEMVRQDADISAGIAVAFQLIAKIAYRAALVLDIQNGIADHDRLDLAGTAELLRLYDDRRRRDDLVRSRGYLPFSSRC